MRPTFQHIEPGDTAVYTISVYPGENLTSPVTLEATVPDPRFDLALAPTSILSAADITLTLVDQGDARGHFYNVPISVTNEDFVWSLSVDLLVGGSEIYLPCLLRQ